MDDGGKKQQQPQQQQQSSDNPAFERESSPTTVKILSHLVVKDRNKIEHLHEYTLSERNDLSFGFGEKWSSLHEDYEFICRLYASSASDNGARPVVRYVDFTKESYDMVRFYQAKIRSLVITRQKAIIFQNIDVQVYVIEENKADGFKIHFQDKTRTKVLLGLENFRRLCVCNDRLEQQFSKFKARKNARRRKLVKAGNAVGSVGKDENKVRPMRVSSHRNSFKT